MLGGEDRQPSVQEKAKKKRNDINQLNAIQKAIQNCSSDGAARHRQQNIHRKCRVSCVFLAWDWIRGV